MRGTYRGQVSMRGRGGRGMGSGASLRARGGGQRGGRAMQHGKCDFRHIPAVSYTARGRLPISCVGRAAARRICCLYTFYLSWQQSRANRGWSAAKPAKRSAKAAELYALHSRSPRTAQQRASPAESLLAVWRGSRRQLCPQQALGFRQVCLCCTFP